MAVRHAIDDLGKIIARSDHGQPEPRVRLSLLTGIWRAYPVAPWASDDDDGQEGGAAMHAEPRGLLERVTTTLVVVTLLVLIAGCGSSLPGPTQPLPGRETRELVVQDYLAGLERRDGPAIESLVSPRVDATRDIQLALAADGGRRLSDVTIASLDEFGGQYVVATVTGTGQDSALHEIKVPIARVDGRYYLALGEAAPNGSEANPASP